VLRYDHFCPWADNPVGFFNYKQYFLLLVYGVLSTLILLAASAHLLFLKYLTSIPVRPLLFQLLDISVILSMVVVQD